ncbi:hypothetical protein POM88_026153 [Heracleum sosnowskyi]|uniref:DUF4283 domain-containing protein n=1 Tax=Heracleum sosnowskyi TaxID=360622 RepID=A0AAD8I6K3_9APIA|nr:hypothetical protein POM88_026153 [Heracleum sosnowskyi]
MGNLHLLALVLWNPDLSLAEFDFSSFYFWVQAHGLPLGRMNKVVAEELATKIGRLVETDCIGDGVQLNTSFLRFRVLLDIRQPLVPGFILKREGLSDLWVELSMRGFRTSVMNAVVLGMMKTVVKIKKAIIPRLWSMASSSGHGRS